MGGRAELGVHLWPARPLPHHATHARNNTTAITIATPINVNRVGLFMSAPEQGCERRGANYHVGQNIHVRSRGSVVSCGQYRARARPRLQAIGLGTLKSASGITTSANPGFLKPKERGR
jgi:hypothetical protein